MFKAVIKSKYDSEIVCDVDLIDDIKSAINDVRYDIIDDDDIEYDEDCGLPEDLWIEQQQIHRLSILQKRKERLDEMYFALDKLIKLTDIEMSELDNA